MKKVQLVTGSSTLLLILFFTSCDKLRSKSKTQLLTQSSWKIEKAGIDSEHAGKIDIPDSVFMKHYNDKQTYIFRPDGSGIFVDERAKNEEGEGNEQTQPFSWKFTGNETKLVLGLDTANVLLIDDHNLKIYYDDRDEAGESERYLTIFKH